MATSNPQVKATAYVHRGRSALIALASFVPNATSVTLSINHTMLGLSAAAVTLTAPVLVPMQPTARTFGPGEPIPIAALQGWILLLK